MIRIAVFASGRGSNFRALQNRLRADDGRAEIVLCISNNPHPGARDIAEEEGIPFVRLSPKMFPDHPEAYEKRLLDLLEEKKIELIVLTGYMRKLPAGVTTRFSGKILNIHPALLPEFGGEGMYGMNVHEAVIREGKKWSGATVHLVDEEYDTGPIIAQRQIEVEPEETAERLAARVLDVEHQLLPDVVLYAAEQISAGEPILPLTPDQL